VEAFEEASSWNELGPKYQASTMGTMMLDNDIAQPLLFSKEVDFRTSNVTGGIITW